MGAVFKFLLVPNFFVWLVNVKVPVAGEEILLSFVYCYCSALLALAILISRNLSLRESSFLALIPAFLLIPTLFYQMTGLTNAVTFEHLPGFPAGPILKISLIALVFVVFNELLSRRLVTVDFVFKAFLLGSLLSIPVYLADSYELILALDVSGNRPYPAWIGGWNTYSFVLSLGFVVLLGPLRVTGVVKYPLLILILAVMLTTLSRGGLLSLLVALFFYWRWGLARTGQGRPWSMFKTSAIIAFGAGAIVVGVSVIGISEALYSRFIESFLEQQEYGETYLESVTSARNVLWLETFSRLTDVDHIYQWFFGYGVGHFGFLNIHGFMETEMASQYVYWIYEYGFIIGLALAAVMFKVYTLLKWDNTHPWARVVKTMFVIFLVSCFVQEFVYTTQVGWLIGVGAAIFLHILREGEKEMPGRRGVAPGSGRDSGAALDGLVSGRDSRPLGTAA